MNVRHYMNVTRVVSPIAERVPTVDELLGGYFKRWGK
jgi:sulfoacetaldehyde dehydrogenase